MATGRHQKTDAVKNLVVVSDLHCGCRLGLCHPDGVTLDDGGIYKPSEFQLKLWSLWREFWQDWVPEFTHGEPFAVVVNGDAIDGVHHNSVTQVSQNIEDQLDIAEAVLAPVIKQAHGRYYHVRGTEAHVGKSGQFEERLAKSLGAIPIGKQYSRWELWKRVGDAIVHIAHHIGTTGSSAYESTAVYKELVESYVESGRWGDEPPDIVVRSHRHRFMNVNVPSAKGRAYTIVTPGWQGRTPFAYRVAGARQQQPQFGGIVIRQGDVEFYVRDKTWRLERGKVE